MVEKDGVWKWLEGQERRANNRRFIELSIFISMSLGTAKVMNREITRHRERLPFRVWLTERGLNEDDFGTSFRELRNQTSALNRHDVPFLSIFTFYNGHELLASRIRAVAIITPSHSIYQHLECLLSPPSRVFSIPAAATICSKRTYSRLRASASTPKLAPGAQ